MNISDEFDNPQGQYINYSTTLDATNDLLSRSHIDIRRGDSSENWTVGTDGPDSALSNIPSLRLALTSGVSVVTSSTQTAIDLTLANSTDEICLALPSFPASSLDLTQCFVRFKDGTNTVTLTFPTLSNGDNEVRWPISSLGSLLHPTIIEFQFLPTANCTVKIPALRILSPLWTETKMDINTIKQRLVPIVDRVGNPSPTFFPKLWRSSDTEDTPLPINCKLGVNFYTGSMTHQNTLSFFFRGRREDLMTQLDLDPADVNDDGLLETLTMSDLDNYQAQPDYGLAMYNPRPQEDFDAMAQTQLDTFSQAYMERVNDQISEAWVRATIRFGYENDVSVSTAELRSERDLGTDVPFLPNTTYLAMIELVDDTIRIRIFPINSDGSIDRTTLVFDSFEMKNDFMIKRRKGHIGWVLDLEDGDAYIDSIRSRGMMYGEWLSQSFESLTPVEGARLYVGSTPDIETPLASLPFANSTISFDTFIKRSEDGSAKVVANTNDGLTSHPVNIEDFENSLVAFDIFYPQVALDAGSFLELYLQNEFNFLVRIGMPGLIGDTWNHVEVKPLLASLQQTGPYSIVIKQDTGSSTFWIDNFTFQHRSIRWDGRSTFMDPWGRNKYDWTDFGSLVNQTTDGIMFPERGNFVQIRGQALTPNASIDKLYIKPKYAQLGRLVWNVDRRYRRPNPGDTY
jgi:hypothetical protein